MDEPLVIARVSQNAHPVGCVPTAGGVQFQCTVPPRSEAMIKVRYLDNRVDRPTPSSMRYELSVAARRILSEFRDEYVLRFARA